MTTWDESVDLVIAGSGGGGVVAALVAIDAGLEPLVLEKQAIVGGSTGMSGGIIWMPNNPLMRAEGVADSHEDGLAYLEDVVGDAGPASSPARRETFLTEGYQMLTFLQRKGVQLVRCEGYSDYYPNAKGGNARGRSVEGVPFDARQLGEWHDKLQPSLAKGYGLTVKTNELRSVQYFNRSPQAFTTAARVFLRTKAGTLRRQELLTNGASLMGQMLKALIDLAGAPPVWTNTAMDDLVVEDGRVCGVRATRDGAPVLIEARKGVLLAAGGFAHNAEMRRKYSGNQPNEAQWSIANAGDTGEVLETAMRLGAKTDLLDEAWWLPSTGRALATSSLIASAATSARDLRRLDRATVLQRVELLCRGGQGDVRAQGGALLAHLRRGLLPPVRAVGEPVPTPVAEGGLRERRGAEGGHARGVGAPDRRRRRRAGAHGATVQRVRGERARSRLRAGTVGLQRLPG